MIQFKKITIHNFGSYSHAELDLQNKGFCLVSGHNNYAPDNALSNGVGKSICFSAICYVLTGETVSGIKSGLRNINIEENECWAELEFSYNKDHYVVTRILAPKSDLRIIRNDVDISGKGIRESEKKLNDVLPEVTKDLITSTVILGQGMPNKFSSFSPSGRKELLEKLTKSDFMIEDLKNRIACRQTELSTKIREYEDSLIANTTQLNLINNKLTSQKRELSETSTPDFDDIITRLESNIATLSAQYAALNSSMASYEETLAKGNAEVLQLTEEKAKINAEELEAYTARHAELSNEKSQKVYRINELNREITKLKSITDVCPTCKQKLPNVIKPSTEAQETEVAELNEAVKILTENLKQVQDKHSQYLVDIENEYGLRLIAAKDNVNTLLKSIKEVKAQIATIKAQLDSEQALLAKYTYDKQHWNKYIENLKTDILNHETEVAKITNIINIVNAAKTELLEHLATVKKMDTLVKRDFRGYLLTNIITYLDKKAKEYCSVVFGTTELSLSLNGNSLDITYCGKMFDLLSGGEKQRVDLILQLAIRDMLITYLDLNANILVLDEVTDFLDKKSCKAIMTLLENALQTVESVFIISHMSNDLEIPVDSEIHIVKNENGISQLLNS